MQILKQRKIGTCMGMLKIIIGNISPYASWLSLALVGVMSFYTTINPVFTDWGIPLPFWVFCVALVVMVALAGIVEWIFMMPSYYEANNRQAWDSGGPLQEKINKMERDIADIKKAVGIKDA